MNGALNFWFFAQSLMYNRIDSQYVFFWLTYSCGNDVMLFSSVLLETRKDNKLDQAAPNESYTQSQEATLLDLK